MNTDREFDRIALAWLAEGPEQLADRVLDAVVDEIHVTPQRRALRLPRRFSSMTTPARVATAAVIGVLAVGGAFFVFKGSGQLAVGGPGLSPAASSCVKPMVDGLPLLEPTCTYTSTSGPAFGVNGVPGAYVGDRTPRATELRLRVASMKASDEPATVRVIGLENVMTKPCNNEFTYNVNQPTSPWTPASAATAPTDFFGWLKDNTPLPAETQPVTIGSHTGLQATFALTPGFLSDCGGGAGTVFVTDYGSTAPGSTVACGLHKGTCELSIEDGSRHTRLAAIEVGGKVVLVAVQADEAVFDAVITEADKLIATMQFE